MSALTVVPDQTISIYEPAQRRQPPPAIQVDYWQHFSFIDAAKGFFRELLKKRPMTRLAYRRDLRVFIEFMKQRRAFPDEQFLESYVAHLQQPRGKDAKPLCADTINRYLAPVRIFLDKLSRQNSIVNLVMLEDHQEMMLWIQFQQALEKMRQSIERAARMPGLEKEQINYEAPVYRGKWLTLEQTRLVLSSIERDTIAGLRDYALMVLGFNTALRRQELQRLTLDCFTLIDSETYTITVEGKRNNWTPVPCPKHAYDALIAYVRAYNAALPPDDDRRICNSDCVWRAFDCAGNMDTDFTQDRTRWGIIDRSIAFIVERRSAAPGHWSLNAAGEPESDTEISCHDMRRTAALLALKSGMPMKKIQMMLRHKSIMTTERYLGVDRDYKSATLTNYDCLVA